MLFYTYNRWVEMNTSEEEPELLNSKCTECNGDGVLECDLGHEHDCETCDGKGVVEDNIIEAYKQAAHRDICKLSAYTGNLQRNVDLINEFNGKFDKLLREKELYYI